MFGKSSIADSEYAYLKQVTPHRVWHYLLLLIALGVGSAFIWFGYDIQHSSTIAIMAAVILGIYWFFQFRIMQSAVHLANHDWQQTIPDELIGTISGRTIILARVRAVLRHHRRIIILMSLALLGLSLVLAGYFLFWSDSSTRGILEYIGVPATGYYCEAASNPILSWWSGAFSGTSLCPWLIEWGFMEWILMMGAVLFATTFTNSILSISIGLKVEQIRRAATKRVVMLIVMFGAFFLLYSLRAIPPLNCHRSSWFPDHCDDVLFQMRLIDSFQAITLSYLDGGTAMATGLHDCGGGHPFWGTYKQRHLVAAAVTVLSQLALSVFYLQRVSLLHGKKKA